MWSIGYFSRTVGTVTEDTIKAYAENQEDKTLDEIFKVKQQITIPFRRLSALISNPIF